MADLTASQITTAALYELENRGYFVWRNNNLSVPGRKFIGMKGVPDVIGFVKNSGLFVVCEVKTKNDKFSEYQKNFLNRSKLAGCITLIATDIDGNIKIQNWE
jgi:hypothetical protein